METVAISEDVMLSLPNSDIRFLRTLAKKMGWTMRRHRKNGIEKGLEDIRKGNKRCVRRGLNVRTYSC